MDDGPDRGGQGPLDGTGAAVSKLTGANWRLARPNGPGSRVRGGPAAASCF